MKKRIVVTGIGIVSSIGIGKDAFWENLIQGKSGISKVESFDTSGHFTHFGGEVKNFIPEKFLNLHKIKMMGRASHLAIAAAKLALEDAGELDLKNKKVSVCIGTTGGESQEIEKMDSVWVKKSHHDINSWSIIQYPVNNITSNVALELKTSGPNKTFTTACAAGNYAIGYGLDLLRDGKAEIVFAGGSDAFSYLAFTGFNQLGAVAPDKCQPFDKNRKGMIPAEGAGIVVLETFESAQKRKAPRIYAEILGYGLSCDAYHMTNPQTEGVAQCMVNALKDAQVDPEDIDYISAHGTATKANDRVECLAINKVFSNRKVAVSSIKSMIGHTMGAASAISTISCCLAVKNDIVPPTINYETPDPECDIDCIPNTSRRQVVNIALNNGFAFGGNNSGVVVSKIK